MVSISGSFKSLVSLHIFEAFHSSNSSFFLILRSFVLCLRDLKCTFHSVSPPTTIHGSPLWSQISQVQCLQFSGGLVCLTGRNNSSASANTVDGEGNCSPARNAVVRMILRSGTSSDGKRWIEDF